MAKKTSYITSTDGEISLGNFVEISVDPVMINNFSNEDSMNYYFNSYSSSEEFQKLKNSLYTEVMNIIQNCLTDRQREVMIMTYIEGKTQDQISVCLGVHQTAVHKAIKGNLDYTNGGKRYGGSIKKIRKLCKNNEKIQNILKAMSKMYEKQKEG